MSKLIKLYVHCQYVLLIISMIHQYIHLKHESHRCSFHLWKETDCQDPKSSICATAHRSGFVTFPGSTSFFYVSRSFNLKSGSYDFSQTLSHSGLNHGNIKYQLSGAEIHFESLLRHSPFPGLGMIVHKLPLSISIWISVKHPKLCVPGRTLNLCPPQALGRSFPLTQHQCSAPMFYSLSPQVLEFSLTSHVWHQPTRKLRGFS